MFLYHLLFPHMKSDVFQNLPFCDFKRDQQGHTLLTVTMTTSLFGLLLLFVAIENFLSHREESGLHRTIIFCALHVENRFLTHMFTTVCYLRGHVTLDCKSPVPVCFTAEETLGMLYVPTARVFPGKVCRRNCTEEYFLIGQLLRCSCVKLLYVVFL